MIKFLVSLMVACFCLYTALNPAGGDSPFKWVVYGLMVLVPAAVLTQNTTTADQYLHIVGKWAISFIALFILHIVFAHEQPLNDIILLLSFTALSSLLVIDSAQTAIYKTLLVLLVIETIVTLPEFLVTMPFGNYDYRWNGMFQNSNTNSIFFVATLIATVLTSPSTKIKKIIYILVFIGVFFTRSRNALLVCVMIAAGDFLKFKLTKFEKILPLILVGVLIFAGYYMMVIEPVSKGGLEMMGKNQGSTGRSLQILYVTSHFDLSWFGGGKIVDSIVQSNTNYPVHNMYIASVYVLGTVITAAYLVFAYWMYRKAKDIMYKICFLAAHFYFFFEPGGIFCVQLDFFLPMLVLCSAFYNAQSKRNAIIKSDNTVNNYDKIKRRLETIP